MTDQTEPGNVPTPTTGDPLVSLATDLDAISEISLADRAVVFERIHRDLTAALQTTVEDENR